MSDPTGLVFDLRKFSIHDGPGIRTAVFLKGCPLACWWCHNPESQALRPERIYRPERCIHCGACVAACPQHAIQEIGTALVTADELCTLCGTCAGACFAEARQIVGHEMTVAEVMAVIRADAVFYDESGGGVTLSGGEPLMQPAFTRALLQACQQIDIHTALDTSGFARWTILDEIRPYVNLFLYDLKLMDDARHRHYTGVSNQLILGNLERLDQAGHALYLRLPVVPGINDDPQNLHATGRFAAHLRNVQRVDLLPYHASASAKYARLGLKNPLPEITPPDNQRLEEIAALLASYGLPVHIGG